MQYTLLEAIDKLEEVNGIIKTIDDGRDLTGIDKEIVRDLLSDYMEILSHAHVII